MCMSEIKCTWGTEKSQVFVISGHLSLKEKESPPTMRSAGNSLSYTLLRRGITAFTSVSGLEAAAACATRYGAQDGDQDTGTDKGDDDRGDETTTSADTEEAHQE